MDDAQSEISGVSGLSSSAPSRMEQDLSGFDAPSSVRSGMETPVSVTAPISRVSIMEREMESAFELGVLKKVGGRAGR